METVGAAKEPLQTNRVEAVSPAQPAERKTRDAGGDRQTVEAPKAVPAPEAAGDELRSRVAAGQLLLQIEPLGKTEGFLYRFIDKDTGEVIREFPQHELEEEAERRGADPRDPGLVFDRAV